MTRSVPGLLVVGALALAAPTSCGDTTSSPRATAPPTTAVTGTASPGPVDTGWLTGTRATTPSPCAGTNQGRAQRYAPTLVVLDAATGALRWQFCPSAASAGISAAVAGRTIVFTSGVPQGDGREYAFGSAGLDAGTGVVRWQTLQQRGSPHVVDDDTVIVPVSNASSPSSFIDVAAIVPDTGAERWHSTGVGVSADDMILKYDGADYVIGLDGNEVVALDTTTGAERWRTSAITRVSHAFARSVVATVDGPPAQQVVVLDAADAAERWRATGMVVFATARVVVIAAADPTRPPSSVAMTNAVVATPAWTIEVRAIDTGQRLWRIDAAGMPAELRPYDAQGLPTDLLPLATSDMGLQMRGALDGAVLWSKPGSLMPMLADDHLVLTVGTDVVAYDARTGTEAWRFAIPCIADRTGCMESSYVQNTAMHNGLVMLAINDFGGG